MPTHMCGHTTSNAIPWWQGNLSAFEEINDQTYAAEIIQLRNRIADLSVKLACSDRTRSGRPTTWSATACSAIGRPMYRFV
jgi:hypothetical protein